MHAAFFDMDGCLVDPRAAMSAAMNHALLELLTSKPREFAEPILAEVGLRSQFEAVYAPSLDALTERKAVKLEEALRAVGSAPDRPSANVMIGDREHDIAAGKECGTTTIGVTWGISDEAELREAAADLIVHRPEELGALLHL